MEAQGLRSNLRILMEPKYEEGQNRRQTWWLWSDKRVLAKGTGFRGKIRVSGSSREAETQVEPGLLIRDRETGRGITEPQLFSRTQELYRDSEVRQVSESGVDLDLWFSLVALLVKDRWPDLEPHH